MSCGSWRVADVGDGPRTHSYRPVHAVWPGLDVEPRDFVAREPQQVSEEEMRVCKPSDLVSHATVRGPITLLTLPSAHSSISCKGSRARWIEVVHHHIGRPRIMTMAQNEEMTRLRV